MPKPARMSAREKVFSYLDHQGRRGRPVTNEEIAIGTKLKEKSVGPLIARLVRQHQVVVIDGQTKRTRSGGQQRVVMLPAHARILNLPIAPVPPRPISRAKLVGAANALEDAANRVLTMPDAAEYLAAIQSLETDAFLTALQQLRIARDRYRELKRNAAPAIETAQQVSYDTCRIIPEGQEQ